MKEYCLYLRKSRKDLEAEQRGEGETLSRHRASLLDLAARRSLPIGKVYEEVCTADTIDDRPEMQRLLRDVGAKMWRGVLVVEVERLARGDTMDQGIVAQTFKYSGTLIITPFRDYDPNNPADEEYFEFGLFMARREYSAIKRRLFAGRMASVKEGKYVGSRDLFGYERYKLPGQKGWSLRIVPERAEIVRLMAAWYLDGRHTKNEKGETVWESMGLNKICNALNEMGIRTLTGVPWERSAVRVILSNPTYIGKVWFNKRQTVVSFGDDGKRSKSRPLSNNIIVADGLHDPILDQDTWKRLQEKLSGNNAPIKDNGDFCNPLNGLVACSVCGRAMVRTPMYGHLAGVDYLKCSRVGCATSSAPLAIVEEMMLGTLETWCADLAVDRGPSMPPPSQEDAQRVSLSKAIEQLLSQQNRLRDLLEQGVYDVATYTDRNALIAQRLAEARASLEKIPPPLVQKEDAIRALLPQIDHVLQSYSSSDARGKNELLKSVISKVIYHKTHRCYRNENPADFITLDVFPVY